MAPAAPPEASRPQELTTDDSFTVAGGRVDEHGSVGPTASNNGNTHAHEGLCVQGLCGHTMLAAATVAEVYACILGELARGLKDAYVGPVAVAVTEPTSWTWDEVRDGVEPRVPTGHFDASLLYLVQCGR